MANRAKRLEKELTLLKVENQFRGRFKKEKVRRKEGLRPTLLLLVNATSDRDFKGATHQRCCSNLFFVMEKLKLKNRDLYNTYLQILQYPKPLFKSLVIYQNLLETFFKLEVCKDFKTWMPPKSKDDVVIFKSLFNHLFVEYKIPASLYGIMKDYCYNYSYGKRLEFNLLIHMVKGGGLHQFPKLPFKVNSKVNHLFFNAPTHFNVIEAIWWAAIRSKKVTPSLASKIVHNLYNIGPNALWFEWMNDLIFFLNRFKDIDQKDLKNILEFFIYLHSTHKCNFLVNNFIGRFEVKSFTRSVV